MHLFDVVLRDHSKDTLTPAFSHREIGGNMPEKGL